MRRGMTLNKGYKSPLNTLPPDTSEGLDAEARWPSTPPHRHSNHLRASPPLQSPRYLTRRNFPSLLSLSVILFPPSKTYNNTTGSLSLHSSLLHSFRPATTCVSGKKLTRFRNLSVGSNPLRTHSEFSFSFFSSSEQEESLLFESPPRVPFGARIRHRR